MKVLLGIPSNGSVHVGTMIGAMQGSSRYDVAYIPGGLSSDPTGNFNTILCFALNEGADRLAFCHADIAPEGQWIDVLMDEMDATGCEFLSVVAPIKDRRGLTSVGLGYPGFNWSPIQRFTMKEICEFPETFSAADIGHEDKVLLHNSGLWLLDLAAPFLQKTTADGTALCSFEFRHRRVRKDGVWTAQKESEDWFFSRKLHEHGVCSLVTRKVKLKHHGNFGFGNDGPWGDWSDDRTTQSLRVTLNPEEYIHDNGYWLQNMEGWDDFDEKFAAAIAAMVRKIRRFGYVVDLGCGPGLYVDYLNRAGRECVGFDGRPGTNEIANCRTADLTNGEIKDRDWNWVLCLEVGEHIPREKEAALLDKIAACREGAIVSWARPGQVGNGHVNCRTEEEVAELLGERGLVVDREATDRLRTAAVLPYFQTNVQVFRRNSDNGQEQKQSGELAVPTGGAE